MKTELNFEVKGHLKVWEIALDLKPVLVFDRHNLIVTQGKGAVMDWLAMNGYSEMYTINPFTAIVLSSNAAAEAAGNTWVGSVAGQIANEGVLHIATGYSSIVHTEGSTTIVITAILSQAYGNDPANNHIRSACVGMGTSPATGGPGQSDYSTTGNERLFSRVSIGDLVKTADKAYSFSWTFSVT